MKIIVYILTILVYLLPIAFIIWLLANRPHRNVSGRIASFLYFSFTKQTDHATV